MQESLLDPQIGKVHSKGNWWNIQINLADRILTSDIAVGHVDLWKPGWNMWGANVVSLQNLAKLILFQKWKLSKCLNLKIYISNKPSGLQHPSPPPSSQSLLIRLLLYQRSFSPISNLIATCYESGSNCSTCFQSHASL